MGGDLKTRFRISSEVARILPAGVVALIVLIAAIIALPRTSTKTVQSESPAGSQAPGATTSTLESQGNVPGAGTAGLKGSSGGTGSSAARVPGGGVTTGPGGESMSRLTPARGPGITDKYIYVGAAYSSQSGAADAAIGGGAAAPSYDTRNVLNAVINYANKHGGFAGRQLKPLYVDISVSQDINTQLQAACAYWTQDHKVFEVPGGYDVTDTCAEKAHTIALGPGSTAQTFAKYPHLIDPIGIRTDRLGQVTVVGLHQAGYFGGKLGLVTWDDPDYREALKAGYIDTLAQRYHITPTAVAYISVPQQFSALGDMSAAVASAVAKFKSLGIDHVMIQDGHAGIWAGDGLTFEWEQQSKSEGYYPRYGGNANNSPGFTVNPHDEENHELIVDDSDGDPMDDAGWHTNVTREKCFKIEADAGYPVSHSNTNDEGIAAGACDVVFFFQRVINEIPVLSSDAFIQDAQHLGKTFPSAEVYGTNLFPGRRDGGDMVRTAEYLQSCQCLQYKGPPQYAD